MNRFIDAWAADTLDDLRNERDSLRRDKEALQDAYTEAYDMLDALCQDESERRAIGGGPDWKGRHADTWSRAFDLVNPESDR